MMEVPPIVMSIKKLNTYFSLAIDLFILVILTTLQEKIQNLAVLAQVLQKRITWLFQVLFSGGPPRNV